MKLRQVSWRANIPFVGPQLDAAWQDSPLKETWDEKIYQPYIQPVLTPKNIVTTLVTLTIGVNSVQWFNNIASNPEFFVPLQTRAELLIEDLRAKYSPAPENRNLEYLLSHPYEVMSEGVEILNTFTSIGASYADAVWRQNPIVQSITESVSYWEDRLCSGISSQAWTNRCTTAFYLPASVIANPADSLQGVSRMLVVDPVSGFVKMGALGIENISSLPGLISAIQKDGLDGAKAFVGGILEQNLYVVFNDQQVQSTLFITGLILLILIATPLVSGGVILGMIGKGAIDLDAAVAAAPDKKSLLDLVTSHEVRTFLVGSTLILGLIFAGLGNKAVEFRVFQDRLSPSAQVAFQDLSLLKQTRLADLAIKLKISPTAMDFYLLESARPGSLLANLPLAEGLRIGVLAEQSGKGAFIADYLTRYGYDAALRNVSAEGLRFYVDQARTPGSVLSYLNPREGVILSELSPASITKVTGMTRPVLPAGVTPNVSTPVLALTVQEVSVLSRLSAVNPNAEYAVLGLYKNGQGYTALGTSTGYTFLNMPEAIYEPFFKDYPGDFRLVNEQFLVDLANQNKPIVLETPYHILETRTTTGAYWEVFEILRLKHQYSLHEDPGPFGYDLLIPPSK